MIRNVRWLLVLLVLFGLENVTAAVRPLLPNRSSKIELRIAAPMLQSLHRTFDGVLHYPTGLLAFDDLLCEYEIVEVHPLFTHDPVSLRNPIFFQVGMDRFFELTCDAFVTLSESERETLLGRLRSIEGIELANFIGLCGPLFTPNDFSLEGRELWGLDTMHCRQAWDLQKGNDEILVATIDTGIDYVHEDLRDNIAINPGEDIDQDGQLSTADNNGIDDDDNGFIDDVIGWDFQSASWGQIYVDLLGLIDSIPGEDYGIPDNDPPDYYGHGTHVAGTIAGCTNNGIGIASGSFNVKQLAIRAAVAFTYNGTRTARGYSNDFVRAIQYVVNRQVRVISISFGGSTPDSSYQAVTEYARENGAIMFAAAGNSDSIEINYPAGYPNVISVASLRRGNLRSTFSNYGPTIGISAPGSSIWSTMTLQSNEATLYASWSGTSMATPNAASVAALIFSKNPSLTPAQVQQYLYQNATNISALNPGYQLGAGGVNAQRSIQATPRRPLLLVSPSARSDTIWLNRPDTIRWSDTQSNAIRIEWNRNFPYDAWQALLATTPNDGIHIWTPTGAELPHVRIRVISNTNILWNDRSDYSVPLMNPQLTIGAHSNVVAYHARDTIRWNMAGVNRVDVKWNRNYPMGSWDTIATNIPAANGQIVWTIPSLPTQHARIKVIDRRYPELSSLSPDDIAIVPPMLAWNDSLNSDSLWGGLPTTLYWDSFGVFGTLKLDIMIGYPTGNWSPIFEELPNTGNTTFMIPTSISNDHVRFRLQWNLDTSVTTITSRDIPITRATYRIVSPNGGENWGINEVHRIEWSSNNPATVLVQLNRTFPSGQWIPISDPVTNANSVLWSVTSPISGRCRVRVIPQSSTMVGDTSDANFQIGVSSVNLDENTIPGELILLSPQPNPANASVTLRFGLPTPLPVKVAIFNVHGQEIAEFPERMYTPGYHSISLNLTQRNGLHSSSGIFIVRVTSASRSYYTKGLYVK